MNRLIYPLYRGKTINRWLLASIYEKKMRFEPMTMSGDINLWLKEGFSIHENPCRKEFVQARRQAMPEFPGLASAEPGEALTAAEGSKKWGVYFPFDNANVELSAFWFVPTYLKAYAYTNVTSSAAHPADFELRTCGGAAVRINGKLVVDFTPYTRNIEQRIRFQAELGEGINELEVCFDDLAERDTQYYFRLDYIGSGKVEIAVPVGERNAEKVQAVEQMLYNSRFAKDTVLEGNVELTIHNPFTQEIECHISSCYEENLAEGGLRSLTVKLAPGSLKTDLGPVENFAMGFNHFELSIEVEGIKLHRILPLQVYPVSLLPVAVSPYLEERKKAALQFLAVHGEENINKAMAILYAGGDYGEAKEIILRQLAGINDRYDCSDFHLVHLYRLWRDFRNKDLFDEEFWSRIKSCILNFRYWMDEPGDDVMWFFSENHALLFHACQLLAGQIFPDETFPNSGLKGSALVVKAEGLLTGWFERFMDEGLTEWNCSAYIPIDVLGLANLYDMAASPAIKESARLALDSVFYYTAVNGFHGILASTFGRSYEKELKGNYINGTSSMCWIGWGIGYLNQSGKASVSFCLSDYTPPAEYAAYMSVPENQSMVFRNTQGYMGHADLYTYKTNRGILATACKFKPGHKGYQEHIVQAAFDPEAQIWINHPGELHAHGSGRPNFWAGNGYLPKAAQYRGLSLVIYKINPEHTVDYTHAYFPVESFDHYVQFGNWCFARKGSGYAAIYADNGIALQAGGLNKDRELVSQGYDNVWIMRISDHNEFAGFDAFVEGMLLSGLTVGPDQRVQLKDPVYGWVEMAWEAPLQVNGTPVQYKGFSTNGLIEYHQKGE